MAEAKEKKFILVFVERGLLNKKSKILGWWESDALKAWKTVESVHMFLSLKDKWYDNHWCCHVKKPFLKSDFFIFSFFLLI